LYYLDSLLNRIIIALFVLSAAILLDCKSKETVQPVKTVSRIVSCAPSITETLFALGLGDKIVGVTSYCKYPPQMDIQKIGGYSDINMEKVISLKPDVVILQKEHQKQRDFFTRFGIHVISIDNKSGSSICSSFVQIGYFCGAKKAADSIVEVFGSSLQSKPDISKAPKVLLCVGREGFGGGSVQSAFIVSRATFYNEIIEASGGRNAYPDSMPHYPKVSREGIIALAPDVIIDLASSMSTWSCSTLVADWNSLNMLPAVRNGNVFCITADYCTVPGPRILHLYQDLREIIQSCENRRS
jgi:iron complex transport system substrate-binding protein